MVVTDDSGELALRSMDSLTLGGEARIGGGFDGMETKLAMRGGSEAESKESADTMLTVVVVVVVVAESEAATAAEAAVALRFVSDRAPLCERRKSRLKDAFPLLVFFFRGDAPFILN